MYELVVGSATVHLEHNIAENQYKHVRQLMLHNA